ncbi:uncharacterized protein LOC132054338 [Lycium ferocissimum]|uniref:uncharacterized protein LOC132054338 n=1 Tax=Lycium ferocissimum TaxID=112874 RepID=UPI0028159621|nr:uncharacterized protein LOC132054338 [Lycium ferocissimum]
MTELVRVKHTGTVKDYQAAFDSVMTRINLSTDHAISIFLNNLKPELSDAVRIGNPCNLPQAYYLARLHESNFAAQSKAMKSYAGTGQIHPRNVGGTGSNTVYKGNTGGYRNAAPVTARMDSSKRRNLTPTEMDEKRAKGLCFFCDEKFFPGHKCKNAKRQLFSLELENIEEKFEEEVIGEELQLEEETGEVLKETMESCAISLQALNGTDGYRTLRLKGFSEQSPIEVFIDSGSTHNFIDESAAVRLKCEVIQIKPQLVQVADGREIPTDKMCKGFKWLMQGAVFEGDFLIFPIGKSDMVLGVQWLYPLEDIRFNFRKLEMEFEYQGKMLTLHGVQPKFKTVEPKAISKMNVITSQFFMVKVRSAEVELEGEKEPSQVEVKELLTEYQGFWGT